MRMLTDLFSVDLQIQLLFIFLFLYYYVLPRNHENAKKYFYGIIFLYELLVVVTLRCIYFKVKITFRPVTLDQKSRMYKIISIQHFFFILF